jgi:hypothetical protein
VIVADRGVLASLVLIAPALGVALYEVLGTGGFDRTFAPSPADPKVMLPTPNLGTLNVVFGLTFCMALIGTANSFREICKELPIYKRERSVGLSVSAYVTSKVLVLVPLTMLQAAALVLIALIHQHGPKQAALFHAWPPGELVFDVALTGVAAMALGLVISAVANSSDKATPLLAGVLAFQLLLAGALFDLRERPGMRELSYLTSTRWGFGAAAASTNLPFLAVNKCHRPPKQGCDADWQHTRRAWERDLAGLGGVFLVSAVATGVFLRRRDPKLPKRR